MPLSIRLFEIIKNRCNSGCADFFCFNLFSFKTNLFLILFYIVCFEERLYSLGLNLF